MHVDGDPASPSAIWMRQPLPSFSEPIDRRDHVARALGLTVGDLLDVPIRTGSAGVPFIYVALRSPEVVDKAALTDRDVSSLDPNGAGIFLLAPIPGAGNEVHTRMLGSDGLGMVEDPATGGASGPLGAFLVNEGILPPSETVEILSRQGYAMGRPSDIHIRLRYSGQDLTQVEVGGKVVPVLEGDLVL